MRKLLIAVLAIAAVFAVVSVALATNVYQVHKAATSKPGKGSAAHHIPTGITFGFKVSDSDPSMRGTVVEKYALGSEGLVTVPAVTKSCSFADVSKPAVPAKCKAALVGSGIAKNAAGANTDRSLATSSPCNLQVRLYNNGHGMIVRLDSNGKPPPSKPDGSPDFDSNAVGCLLPIATAIDGKFKKTKIAGKPASDFVFTVPQNLKHPLAGIDNSIRESVTKVALKTKTIRGVKHGFYEKVGCKGNKRTTRATFTTEATSTQPAQKFSATKQTKC
jgi:hypothetical protein